MDILITTKNKFNAFYTVISYSLKIKIIYFMTRLTSDNIIVIKNLFLKHVQMHVRQLDGVVYI